MDTLIMIAQFFLCLSILIVLHEGGHYLAARLTGTRVEKFYLFFDFLFPFPNMMNFSIFKKKIGDTEYGMGWFPMGGYVSIAGMQDETDKEGTDSKNTEPAPDEYGAKSRPQKLLIMLGGVIVNFVLGFLLFGMVLWIWGEEKLPNSEIEYGVYVDELGAEMGLQDGDKILAVGDKPFDYFNTGLIRLELGLNDAKTITVNRNGQAIELPVADTTIAKLMTHANKSAEIVGPRVPYIFGEIIKGSPADKAGMMAGDSIVSLNGQKTPYQHQFLQGIRCKKKEDIQVGYYRTGKDTIQYATITLDKEGKMGVMHLPASYYFELEKVDYSLAEAMPAGFRKGMGFINTQIQAFKQMFQGKIKAQESLGGFGSIGGLFGGTWNWHNFWNITAMLSLILAIMNLLPIPLLDGGYVLFLLIEMVIQREIPERIMNVLLNIGLYLILGLMLFANGMDIIRGWGGAADACL